jgi:hypothetical protein
VHQPRGDERDGDRAALIGFRRSALGARQER